MNRQFQQKIASSMQIDYKSLVIVLVTLLILPVFWYFGRADHFTRRYLSLFPDHSLRELYPFFYFCINSVLLRLFLPILVIKLLFKQKLRDFGFRVPQGSHAFLSYFSLFLLLIPFVYLASQQISFTSYYPQSRALISSGVMPITDLILFELVYGLLFLSGESFWRGFMIFGLEERWGQNGILIMLIPYVMSHFGKPFPEVIGAIIAGLVLGHLALKHRSFYYGILLHWAVAILMDLMAIRQLGVHISLPL